MKVLTSSIRRHGNIKIAAWTTQMMLNLIGKVFVSKWCIGVDCPVESIVGIS